jgi:hypothetical protein
MRKKLEENHGALVESVTCKLCKEVLILPKTPPLVTAEPMERIAEDYGNALVLVMKHIVKQHGQLRTGALMWSSMFSEFLMLSVMECEVSATLLDQYNVKRLQLLRLVQRGPADSLGRSDDLTGPEDIRHYYEETELVKELEGKGFKLATGFLPEQSPIIKP